MSWFLWFDIAFHKLIEYNIFGMPMIGADICGFFIDVQDAEM